MAEKIFTVDKFLGINESADSSTELKLGEASQIENFNITDDYNLKSRPGVKNTYRCSGAIKAVWDGLIGIYHFLIVVNTNSANEVFLDVIARNKAAENSGCTGVSKIDADADAEMNFFQHGDKLYLKCCKKQFGLLPYFVAFYIDNSGVLPHEDLENIVYVPLYLSSVDPASGSGDEIERLNLIPTVFSSGYMWIARLQYSADGTATKYKLPDHVKFVRKVKVDNQVASGNFSEDEQSYTFASAPAKGVNNVEFLVGFKSDELHTAATILKNMKHSEAYNGATDTRTFFYGNGTNLSYYTGAPAHGSGLYVPVGNELAVDSSASMITGMRRQGSRLMAFKPDGAFSIDYTTVTLADGNITAGFYVYPVHRGIGNDMDNQVQTVGNYARTLCAGSLYEWRYSASYHQDERYAKLISQKVKQTLSKADYSKIVTCDDNSTQTYYMFLNDEEGTVIVNRYNIDVWTIYKGDVFTGVNYAMSSQKDILFVNDEGIFTFDAAYTFDDAKIINKQETAIKCVWESGYMSFGADYLKKHSSTLWISMLPENKSRMHVTVKTDKKDEYIEKSVGQPLLDFSDISFPNFSFLRSNAPQIKRIKIKVKKFVYYKLIFKVATTEDTAGDRATVLGYDQQIRYSSAVK